MDGEEVLSENSGQEKRSIAHAPGHVDCPACMGARKVIYQALTPDLKFSAAFDIWISHRLIHSQGVRTDASYLARKTERDYRVCAKALSKFFGSLQLGQIHVGHLMAYQQARAVCDRTAGDWAHPAGGNCIRKEIALLIRILRSARLWGDEEEQHFHRLRPVESDVERALTIEEQHRLLHVAASSAGFRFMYQYVILALQTTAGTNELRALRLGDVFVADRFVQIPRAGAKNRYRMRAIPLVTEDAVWALEGLIARARELGSVNSAHYLFPIQATRGTYDPERPMSESGLKKPWDRLRVAAGLPKVRLYDLRATGITRMAEAGVPLRVTMTFAGHMTVRIQQRYEAICMSAKRGWGATVWGNGMERAALKEAAAAAAGVLTPKPPMPEGFPVRMERAV